MNEEDQTCVPRSFIDLFLPPGAVRPRESREYIAERHELCEDMAQMLTETARAKLFDLGLAESDVLDRVHDGLTAEGSALSTDEAWWVACRLAELLDWPMPPARPPGGEGSRDDTVASGDSRA